MRYELPPAPPCPRCASTLIDSSIDVSRSRELAEWDAFKEGEGRRSLVGFLMCVFTLTLWGLVFLAWTLALYPARQKQKAAALAQVPRCTRRHCRNCGLDFFDDERAAFGPIPATV